MSAARAHVSRVKKSRFGGESPANAKRRNRKKAKRIAARLPSWRGESFMERSAPKD